MSDKGKKKKKSKATGRILTLLIIVCLGVMGFSAYKLISMKQAYRVGEKEYDALLDYTTPAAADSAAGDTPETEAAEDAAAAEDDTTAGTAAVTKTAPIQVDFEGLKAINQDIVGWIYIGALNLSYPVVQGEDNDYYLHRTFEKTDNFAGSIFMDMNNTEDFSDMNTILYGHNMKDQSMFGSLKKLKSEELYRNDDEIWILTLEGDYCYQMFSMEVVDPDDDVYTLFSGPGANWLEYLEKCRNNSEVTLEEIELTTETRIITLSTCANGGSSRFVVQGVLMEDAE